MKIDVYTRHSMSNWYPKLLRKVLIELGHESQFLSNHVKPEVDNDITFFITWGHPICRELPNINGKTKCKVLIETEQLFPLMKKYWRRFPDDQERVDILVFPFSKKMDIGNLTKKPVLSMPLGYHPYMQYTASPLPRRNIFTLEGITRVRRPFFDAIAKAGFSSYSESSVEFIFDLQEIANLAASSDICLTMHAFGPGSFMSTFRVVGLFMYNHGFVMSQRADEPFLEENKHIVYFDDVDEMVEKCRHYIANQDEARKIAEEAYRNLQALAMADVVEDTVTEICKLMGW